MGQRVGLVLAGGRGERLGRTKGDLSFQGKTLAERAAAQLWSICGSVLVSISEGAINPASEYPCLVDPPPAGRGPLAAIDAAFDATGDADLLVLACDYPFVTQELMGRLASHAMGQDDVVMMTDFAGRDHPLVALWCRHAASTVHEAVAAGRFKVRGLLPDLSVRRLGPAEFQGVDLDRALFNLNRPEDLKAIAEPGR
jgi:molybdopterin-guanine dinucleotide biosynthesis protein A